MVDTNNPEIFKVLADYIRHVGDCEGVDFLSYAYKECFDEASWNILMKAREASNGS